MTDQFTKMLCRGLHKAGVYFCLPVLTLILSIDVILRYGFNSPLIWGSEVSALILLIVFFASLPEITRINGHIRMDMIYRKMSAPLKRVTDAVTGLCGLIFALLLTYQSFKSTVEMYRWEEGAEMINIPYWPFVLFAGVCGLILTFQFSSQVFLAVIPPAGEESR